MAWKKLTWVYRLRGSGDPETRSEKRPLGERTPLHVLLSLGGGQEMPGVTDQRFESKIVMINKDRAVAL
eukprot:1690647-Amphidinium_carterae.1